MVGSVGVLGAPGGIRGMGVRRYGSIGIMGCGDVGVCEYVSSRENEYGKIVKEGTKKGTKEGQGREG